MAWYATRSRHYNCQQRRRRVHHRRRQHRRRRRRRRCFVAPVLLQPD